MVLKEKQIFCAREGVPDRAVRAVDIGNEPIYAKSNIMPYVAKIYSYKIDGKPFWTLVFIMET